ncbi:unnamed protein product [Cutaneotrichosporon oleaginosum]
MEALTTAAGAVRLASALASGSMRTRAWRIALRSPDLALARALRMQESADGFALGVLLPIMLATTNAVWFRHKLARAGVDSVGAPLCFFAAAVVLQVVAVHVAALDVVAGPGWARLEAVG